MINLPYRTYDSIDLCGRSVSGTAVPTVTITTTIRIVKIMAVFPWVKLLNEFVIELPTVLCPFSVAEIAPVVCWVE